MRKEQASMRNWQKARLTGFTLIDSDLFTESELQRLHQIRELRQSLLDSWDLNTTILIGHSLPAYKCDWCGRRSNRQHLFEGANYCNKHFKELNGN